MARRETTGASRRPTPGAGKSTDPASGANRAPKPTDAAGKSDDVAQRTADGAADAADHFVAGILTRGEAATPDADGQLPPGATHEIVEEDADGNATKIKRQRYSAF